MDQREASNSSRAIDWPFLSDESAAGPTARVMLDIADDVMQLYHVRKEVFDGLIHDAPFNILLDLFIREKRHQSVSVGDAVLASGTPQTTALRAIHNMINAGDLTATDDPLDSRRKLLHLTPQSQQQMQQFLAKAERLFSK
jgi:hypothetical protein